MVNMDDVAVRANVSKATVSRVLSGKKIVSPVAREKVLASCRELGYKLNHNIQDLILKSRNGFTRNIAFVIVGRSFADPTYAHHIDAIAKAVNEAHYQLLLVKLDGGESSIYDLPPILRDERVDGIIITGALQKSVMEVIKSLDSKCVALGNYSERILGGVANIRYKTGCRIANMMERLVRAGKRRIGFVEENPDNYEAASLFAVYKESLDEHNLPFVPDICYFGKGAFSGISEVLLPVMKSETLPFDSLICPDLRIAREVCYLLFGRFGLNRPIDITLATMRLLKYYTLPVPAVYSDAPVDEYMEIALRHLIDQIERNEKPRTILTDG